MLPMAVVENDASAMKDSTVATTAGHKEVSAAQRDGIADLRRRLTDSSSADRNNPIFADSLGSLMQKLAFWIALQFGTNRLPCLIPLEIG